MARKSTSTASGAAKAPECCAKCESDISELRKEVAALKAAIAKRSAGGADPRVDKILEALVKYSSKFKSLLS
jgi:hypothetical protein